MEVKVPTDSGLLYHGCFWQYAWRSCRGHGGAAYWWLLSDFNLILAWQHSYVQIHTFNDDRELLRYGSQPAAREAVI